MSCTRTSENEDFVSVPQTLNESTERLTVLVKEKSVNSIVLSLKNSY